MVRYQARGEDALAAALHEAAPARPGADRPAGRRPDPGHAAHPGARQPGPDRRRPAADELAPVAAAEAELAFDLLRSGLAHHYRR